MMSIPSTPPHIGTAQIHETGSEIDNPIQIGLHQDPFPDYYGGSVSSVPCQPKEEFSRDDNGCAPAVKENGFSAPPVPPGSGGEGLPYAPIDWPNPGDNWSWKVGKRFSASGFYSDRFLSVPRSLRLPNCPKMFASKPSIERFLLSIFPDADINAFFASFSWKIPAILETPTKAATPAPVVGTESAKNQSNTEDTKTESNKKTPRSGQRKRTTPKSRNLDSSNCPKKQKATKRQSVKHSSPPPLPPGTEDINGSHELSFLDDETTREEFEQYLGSLDDILAQPLSEEPFSRPVLYNYFAAENEMAEARMKLSSFLDMDFPSLICFKDLDELTSLASKLRKDPTLTVKLIEEIPSFCEVFLENREVMEQADKSFTTLEVNKAKVTSLKQEYSELKEQVTYLQSEVDSISLSVQEVDKQIAQLKSRRAQLTRLIDDKKKDKDELTYNQRLVVNSIPKVVHEVQLGNAGKAEWELKKANAERREAEILAKFDLIKGFSL